MAMVVELWAVEGGAHDAPCCGNVDLSLIVASLEGTHTDFTYTILAQDTLNSTLKGSLGQN